MATKGDISDLDVLQFNGKPLIPLINGFARRRTSSVVNSTASGGRTKQRKRYYGACYTADAQFFIPTAQVQDYLKIFFERNEGKTFVCHLAADRPIVEPYTVRVVSDWEDSEVSPGYSILTVTLEIDSVRVPTLDDLMFEMYNYRGEDTYAIFKGISQIVRFLP